MLNTVEYLGHDITLTEEERGSIYGKRVESLRAIFDDMTGREHWDLPCYWDRFHDGEAVAYFVFNRIENALTAYNKGLKDGLEWSDAARKALEELANTVTDEDIDRIQGCAREELLTAWELWQDDFGSEAEAQYVREHIDEAIPMCLNDWISEPDESELTLAWNCLVELLDERKGETEHENA